METIKVYECDNCGKEYEEKISRCSCCCSVFNEKYIEKPQKK